MCRRRVRPSFFRPSYSRIARRAQSARDAQYEGMERRKALGRLRGALGRILRSTHLNTVRRRSCALRSAHSPSGAPPRQACAVWAHLRGIFRLRAALAYAGKHPRQTERAPRARTVVSVGRGPKPPGSWLTRPARRQPHPVPPARRLMRTPSNGQDAANINAETSAGISSAVDFL